MRPIQFLLKISILIQPKVPEETFESVVSVRSVRIPRKGAKKELSMGFGFVEFASIKDAQKAMKRLQHTNIDGHTIQLKLSVQTGNRSKTVKGGKKGKCYNIKCHWYKTPC